MKKSRVTYALILLFILFLNPFDISGIIKKNTLEERVKRSDLIIVGEVQNTESKWINNRTTIYTYVTVSVEECIKGTSPLKNIVIRCYGGAIKEEDVAITVPDSPSFGKGQKVLLMLRFFPDTGEYVVLHGKYGKYTIIKNYVRSEGISKDEFIKKIKNIILKEKH